jgi:threonine dehydrogenase-like Zn-dependent dehydrogenase
MKGKAAIFADVGTSLELQGYPLKAIAGAMLTDISMVNICGSNLYSRSGPWPGFPPASCGVLDHQVTGDVAKLGRDERQAPLDFHCPPFA